MNIKKYFPEVSEFQIKQFEQLIPLYTEWNNKINVISRKDIDNLYINHILSSLAIAKIVSFKNGTKILDVGTGGGFPGIPLAIMFPECKFHLIDSIGKKITVVQAVIENLGLENTTTEKIRVENINTKFNFIVSRAVTTLPVLYGWVNNKILSKHQNTIKNGILYLKGGDVDEEVKDISGKYTTYNISDYYTEEYFKTKKVIHIQIYE